MTNVSIKTQIAKELNTEDLSDTNGVTRRYFSLWIEGSYLGQEHSAQNLQQISSASSKSLRSFVIQEFSAHVAHEYNCTVSHAQKCIVAALPSAELETLTANLTQDCLDWADCQFAEVAA